MNYSCSCQKYDVVHVGSLVYDGGHLKKISDHFDSGNDWIATR